MSRRRTNFASEIEGAFEPKRLWNAKVRKEIQLESDMVEELKHILLTRSAAVNIEAYLEERVKPHSQAIYSLLFRRLSKRVGANPDPYSFNGILTEQHEVVVAKFGMFSTSQRQRAEAAYTPSYRPPAVVGGLLERKQRLYYEELMPLLALDEEIVARMKDVKDVKIHASLLLELASVYARFNEFFVNNSLTLEEPIGPAAFSLYYKHPPIVEPTLLRPGVPTQLTREDRSRIWTANAEPFPQPTYDNDTIVISDDEAMCDALPVGPYDRAVVRTHAATPTRPKATTYASSLFRP